MSATARYPREHLRLQGGFAVGRLARCILIPCGLKAADCCHLHWPEGRTHVSAKVRFWGERILVLDTLCRVPGRYVDGGPASFLSGCFVSLTWTKPRARGLMRGGCESAPQSVD